MLEVLDHAHKNLLSEKCKVLPAKGKIFSALATCPKVIERSYVTRKSFGEIFFSDLIIQSDDLTNEPYDCQKISKSSLFSESTKVLEIDFTSASSVSRFRSADMTFPMSFKASRPGMINCIVTWFELQFSESMSLSTEPGSTLCWEQTVYPLKKSLEMNKDEEFKVVFHMEDDVLKMTEKEPYSDNASKNFPHLTLPSICIRRLNACKPIQLSLGNQLTTKMKSITKIFDLSEVPILSLQILKSFPNASLTMLVNEENSKFKVDFVYELSKRNSIVNYEKRVFGVSEIIEENHDLLIFEPISVHGRLNDSALKHLGMLKSKLMPKVPMILPMEISLHIALVESEELLLQNRLDPEDPFVKEFNLDLMNMFSANHVQSIDLENIRHKFLSEVINVMHFKFENEYSNFKQAIDVKVKEKGVVHAILYWWNIHHDENNVYSSKNVYDTAAFLVGSRICSCEEKLKVLLTFEDWLIDLNVVE